LGSRYGHFTPKEKAHSTHWIGGWVGSRASLDVTEKRKMSCHYRESNPGRPAYSPSLSPTELSSLISRSRIMFKRGAMCVLM
jgi:hypothetical protein